MKRLTRIFIMLLAIFILSLTGIWFYINSGYFIQQQVLPRLSKSLGTEIKAEKVNFSLISGIHLENVILGPKSQPLMTAEHILARYHLKPMLSQKYYIDKLEVSRASVTIDTDKEEKSGESNPDVQDSSQKKEEVTSHKTKVEDLIIKNIHFKDLNVDFRSRLKNDQLVEARISNLDLDIPELAINKDFSAQLTTRIAYKAGSGIDAKSDNTVLSLKGKIDEEFQPGRMDVNLFLKQLKGIVGGQVELKEREIHLAGSITHKGNSFDIEGLQIREIFQGTKEASIKADGHIDTEFNNTKIDYDINNIGPSLLNLLLPLAENNPAWEMYQEEIDRTSQGTVSGIGNMRINLKGRFESSQKNFLSKAEIGISDIPAPHTSGSLRQVHFSSSHDFSYDRNQKEIAVRHLEASLVQDQNSLVNITASGSSAGERHILKFQQAKIEPAISDFIPQKVLGDTQISNLNITAENLIIEQNHQGIEAKGFLNAENIALSSATNSFKKCLLSPRMSGQVSLSKEGQMTFTELKTALATSIHPDIPMTINGTLDSKFRDIKKSDFHIAIGSTVDVDKIIAYFSNDNQSKSPAKSDQIIDQQTTLEEEKPFRIAGRITAPLVHWQGLSFKDISLDAAIDGSTYTINDSSFKIMNTPVDFNGLYKANNDYEIMLDSGDFEFKPWLQLYAPQYVGRLDGAVRFENFQFSGGNSLSALDGSGQLKFTDVKAKNFAALPDISNKGMLSVFNLATSSLTEIYSQVISTSLGFDPNDLQFTDGYSDLKIDDGKVRILSSSLNNEDYKLKIDGDYNLNNNNASLNVRTGLSGLVTIDKSLTKYFTEGDDGLRYLSITIDTDQIQSDGFLGTLSKLSGSYALKLLKGILSAGDITKAIKKTGKNLFRSLTDIIVPSKKEIEKKETPQLPPEKEPEEEDKNKRKERSSDKIIRKIFNKLF